MNIQDGGLPKTADPSSREPTPDPASNATTAGDTPPPLTDVAA